jgi:hypothetical protein
MAVSQASGFVIIGADVNAYSYSFANAIMMKRFILKNSGSPSALL